MGLPYVLSSDLVSAYPAKSLEIAQYVDGLIPLLAMTQNAQTGVTYSFLLTDFTKLVTLSNASAVAVTLPLESSVAWPTGTQLRLLNLGAGTVTVAGAVGVTINGTPLTLAQYKGAVITKTGTNTWVFLPFSGGSAPAVISSTTGSPTITTDAGASVYLFTGDGTIVVGTGGTARVCVIGAGGGGGPVVSGESGGGGGGGWMSDTTVILTAGTWTVKIGSAGAAGVNASTLAGGRGGDSYLSLGDANLASPGGGGGASDTSAGNQLLMVGASGGGGNYAQVTSGKSVFTSGGFSGGNGANYSGGGGGGIGGAGANGVALSITGATGGLGKDSDILISATAVFYGGGGGAGKSSAGGTAGTGGSSSGGAGGTNSAGVAGVTYGGGGGGGGLTGNNNGGAGNQGAIIVRVG